MSAEEFPREVFRFSIYFLHGLIHGYGAYGNRTVAHNPFARFMYVLSRGKVHQRVASPFATPYAFFHFLVDAGSGGRVADVGIDFHQEVSPDNHRLRLRMIDVGGQHGASGRYLVAHELRCDVCVDAHFGTVHILSDGHILHFRCDDSLLA